MNTNGYHLGRIVHARNTFLYRYQYFYIGSFVLMLYYSLVKNSAMIMQMNMKTLILYEKLFMVTIHSFTDVNSSQQSYVRYCVKSAKSISNGNSASDNTV